MCQRVFAEANHPLARTLPGGGVEFNFFFEEGTSMPKNSKRIPPALKHGIYSGLGYYLPKAGPNSGSSENKYLLNSTWSVDWRGISATKLFYWNGAGDAVCRARCIAERDEASRA
jgi:hypothetical protein